MLQSNAERLIIESMKHIILILLVVGIQSCATPRYRIGDKDYSEAKKEIAGCDMESIKAFSTSGGGWAGVALRQSVFETCLESKGISIE